ncbi:hypothetical protein KY342_00275 [Candidatus Woesearchaeota archaeon]|nr:hypothetical protein [Candidatus Woesearchaeota archaeon]
MILPLEIHNRTRRQRDSSLIDLLRKKCADYTTTQYTRQTEVLSDEIKVLLESLNLDNGYDALIKNLENQRTSYFQELEKRFKSIQNDKRSLSEIINSALEYYSRYKKTKDEEEIAKYLGEMESFKRFLVLFCPRIEQSNNRDLGRYIVTVLNTKNPINYSEQQLTSLSYATNKLENEEINLDILGECIVKLREIII